MKIRTGFLLTFTSALVLTSCSWYGDRDQASNDKADQVLNAEGSWKLVEDQKKADPLSQHMAARGLVDPSHPDDNVKYTKQASAESGDTMHFRVLRLERQMADLQGDIGRLLPDSNRSAAAGNIRGQQTQAALDNQARYNEPAAPVGAAEPLALAPPPPDAVRSEQDKVMAGDISVPMSDPVPPPMMPLADAPPEQMQAIAPAAGGVPEAPSFEQPIMPASENTIAVTGVRVGDHPGKARLVLDISGPANFSYDIDNNENILLVDLPGVAWDAGTPQALRSALVRGYSAQRSPSGGTMVAIELAGPAKVLNSMTLPPAEEYGNRIVLDLGSL